MYWLMFGLGVLVTVVCICIFTAIKDVVLEGIDSRIEDHIECRCYDDKIECIHNKLGELQHQIYNK